MSDKTTAASTIADDVPVIDGWVASETFCPATDPHAFFEALKAGATAGSDTTENAENDEAAREERRLALIDMVNGTGDRPEWATGEDDEMAAQLRDMIGTDTSTE